MNGPPRIAILFETVADFQIIRRYVARLQEWRVPYAITGASALVLPESLTRWMGERERDGVDVFIVATGGGATLAGAVARRTRLPVIGVPLDTTLARGQDALHAMLALPPSAVVGIAGINALEGAFVQAIRTVALKRPEYAMALEALEREWIGREVELLGNLREQYPEVFASREARKAGVESEPPRGVPETEPPRSAPESLPARAERELREKPARRRESRRGRRAPAQTAAPVERPVDRSAEQAAGKTTEPSGEHAAEPTAAPAGTTAAPAKEATGPIAAQVAEGAAEATPAGPEAVEVSAPPPVRHTRYIAVDAENPDVAVIEKVADILLEGGVVVIPTDTVYGLAALSTNTKAMRRLYEIKARDLEKPIPLLIHSVRGLRYLVREVPELARAVLDAYWPGALTVVFRKYSGSFPDISEADTIGLRMPNHNVTLAVLSIVSRPLAVTSANFSGLPPARTAQEALEIFGGLVDCVLDAGPMPGEKVSTVLSVADEPFRVLREGAVRFDELKALLGENLAEPEPEPPAEPEPTEAVEPGEPVETDQAVEQPESGEAPGPAEPQ